MGFWSGIYGFLFGFNNSRRNRRPQVDVPWGGAAREVVSLDDYWQGRDQQYSHEWTPLIRENAYELLKRVNLLLQDLNVVSARVVSGWRPSEVNQRVGGAARSLHITGQAVDLRDNSRQEFGDLIIRNNHLLHKYQLWLESPEATRGNTNWIHLDMGIRDDRDLRVFNP